MPSKTMTSIKKTLQSLSLLALFLAANFAFGEHGKLSPELSARRSRLGALVHSQNPGEMMDVIVQARPGTSLSEHRQKLLGLGATQKNNLDFINGTVLRIPASMLPALEEDPDIAYVTPDRKSIHLSQEDFVLDATQSSGVINAGYTGYGIGVAIIDSGVRTGHPMPYPVYPA